MPGERLLRWPVLLQLGVRLVAIERPDGVLIDRPLDAGLSVIAVHPEPDRCVAPAISGRRWEERQLRQLRGRRARADR